MRAAVFEDFRKKAMGVAFHEVNIAGPIVGVKVAGITGRWSREGRYRRERRILRRGMKPDWRTAYRGERDGDWEANLEKTRIDPGIKRID